MLAVVIVGLALGLVVAAWRERRSDLVYADDTAGARARCRCSAASAPRFRPITPTTSCG